jgi:hypothetical protein
VILARYSSDGQQEERRIRRWRTGIGPAPAWSQRYQGFAQTPELIGGFVAEQQAASDGNTIKWGAVATGVITGVSVWFVTRMLNKWFAIEKK